MFITYEWGEDLTTML